MKKAYLRLADGTLFEGRAVGAEGSTVGAVAFHTGMVGYQELVTDPANLGRVICMTYPMIGNYGINLEDFADVKAWASGLILREMSELASNWRSLTTLPEFLAAKGVVAMDGIDTRALTRKLRRDGVMNGILYTEGFEPDEAAMEAMKTWKPANAVMSVTRSEKAVFAAKGETQYKVALLDCGMTRDFADYLCENGCEVTALPANTDAETILDGGFDGVLLSDGPADPAENAQIVSELKKIIDAKVPVFGVSLGHQLIALALGCATCKLPHGHHGANQPVVDKASGRTLITAQNHDWAVTNVADDVTVTYENLNDRSVEGIAHKSLPVFSVQFCPDTCPGPHDTSALYHKFFANMDAFKGGAR